MLNNNDLHGSIPENFGKLANLTQLQLYVNQLEGIIPQSIANMTRLQYLNLFENKLRGSIPTGKVVEHYFNSHHVTSSKFVLVE